MAIKDNGYLEQFRKSLEGWTDERFATRAQLDALATFHLYLVNLAEDDGWQYDGHTWKNGDPMGCLVVKATVDDIPSVVFTSARSPTGGIVTFMRKLAAGLLEWRPDRYRT